MPITTTSPQPRVTLYLGDGSGLSLKNTAQPLTNKERFQALASTDIFNTLSTYIHRVANSNKDLASYPLVFTQRSGLDAFNTLREKCTDARHDTRPKPSGDRSQDLGQSFLHALRTVRAFHADEFAFAPGQKIYIDGHGAPGVSGIVADGKVFSMHDVATTLKTVGVPKDIRDVRLTSCHSADVIAPHGQRAPDLSVYSRPIAEGDTVRQAPAEHLSDALAEAGFNRVVVTGYHGLGMPSDGERFPMHSVRNITTPKTPGHDPNATVRRSTVAQRFSSEVDY